MPPCLKQARNEFTCTPASVEHWFCTARFAAPTGPIGSHRRIIIEAVPRLITSQNLSRLCQATRATKFTSTVAGRDADPESWTPATPREDMCLCLRLCGGRLTDGGVLAGRLADGGVLAGGLIRKLVAF